MPIVVVCACGRQLQAKEEFAGKRVKCPQCGQPVPIPGAASTPATGGTKKQSKSAPASGDDLFGDLGSLESVAGNPLGGSPMQGGNPLYGPMGSWQEQPTSRKSRANPIMWVGIGGGGLAILILGILFIALLTRVKDPPDTPVAVNPTEKQPESPTVPPRADQAKSPAPSSVPPPIAAADPQPTPNETPTPTTSSTPTTPTDPPERTWRDLGPALTTRLDKPAPFKGVTLIGPDPVIIAGYSWMTQLLPYLGEEERHQEFDFTKSWLNKVNLQLTGPVPAFLNPADPREAWEGWPYDGIGLTHFVGVSGIEETRNDIAALLPRSDPRAGMFGYEEIARPAQITDGASQTLMLIGSGALAAPWVQGGGATIRGLREPYFDELTGFGSQGLSEPGAMVMFADGSAKTMSAKISPQVLRSLATIRGAESVDQSQLSGVIK